MVQYLVLSHACKHPQLTTWSDNIRLLETLAGCDIIDAATSEFLKSAYLAFRAQVHKRNLQKKPTRVPDTQFVDLRNMVSTLWKEVMLYDIKKGYHA